jgi:diphthine synthase
MLLLIGLGISGYDDIPVKGIDELLGCDEVYAEAYTSDMKEGAIERIEEKTGKKITLLKRKDVEEGKLLVEKAKEKKVALLVPGDPLIATTHVSLIISARKKGVKTKVIHSSSIISAGIGESGLHPYKFGRMATLAFWREGYKPTSPYDAIMENRERGLHTLLLLDRDEKIGRMDAKKGVELLLEMEKEKRKGLITNETAAVVLSRVGYEEQKVSFGKIGELLKKELGPTPHIIIIPASLHFLEEEYLLYFK